MLGELAALVELHANVEGSLSAHGYKNRVGLLLLDDFEDLVGCHGQEVDLVGEA